MTEQFTCAVCRGTFDKMRSDEEALAEMAETWQPTSNDYDLDIVCDDCFQRIVTRAAAEAPEVLRPGAAARWTGRQE